MDEKNTEEDERVPTRAVQPKLYNPVDIGWAWVILASVFLNQTVCIGWIRSYGVLFTTIQAEFDAPAYTVAFLGGTQSGVLSVFAVVVMSVLIKHISIRRLTMLGGAIGALGISSCFFANSIIHLILAAVCTGLSMAMTFGPGFILLGTYFRDRRPLALAVANTGGSVGGLCMPYFTIALLDRYGLHGTFLLLGGIYAQVIVLSAFFTPPTDYKLRKGTPEARLNASLLDLKTDDSPNHQDFAESSNSDMNTSQVFLEQTPDNSCLSRAENSAEYLAEAPKELHHFHKGLAEPSVFPSIALQEDEAVLKTSTHSRVYSVFDRNRIRPIAQEALMPTSAAVGPRTLVSTLVGGPTAANVGQRVFGLLVAGEEKHNSKTHKVGKVLAECSSEEAKLTRSEEDSEGDGGTRLSSTKWVKDTESISEGCKHDLTSSKDRPTSGEGSQASSKDSLVPAAVNSENSSASSTEIFVTSKTNSNGNNSKCSLAVSKDSLTKSENGPVSSKDSLANEGSDDNRKDKPESSKDILARSDDSLANCRDSLATCRNSLSRGKYGPSLSKNSSVNTISHAANTSENNEVSSSPTAAAAVSVNPLAHAATGSVNSAGGSMHKGVKPNSYRLSKLELTLLKMPLFWLLLVYLIFGMTPFALPGTFMTPLAVEKGFTVRDGAELVTISGGLNILSGLVPGIIAQMKWLRPETMVVISWIIEGLTFQFTAFYNSMAGLIFLTAVYGLCAGVFITTLQLIIIDFVGLERFPVTFGAAQLVMGLSAGIFIPLLGFSRDVSGSYVISYHLMGASLLLGALCLILEPLVRGIQNRRVASYNPDHNGLE